MASICAATLRLRLKYTAVAVNAHKKDKGLTVKGDGSVNRQLEDQVVNVQNMS